MEADSGGDNTGFWTDAPGSASQEDTWPDAGTCGSANLPDPQKLAQDWITLWQSELSALAADPEMREAWQTMAALWAGAMSSLLRAMPRTPTHDPSPRRARPNDAPRTSAAAASSDPRDAEIGRLASHVAALERRLAELERGGSPASPAKRRPRRKS
jgi:hypothetical protein